MFNRIHVLSLILLMMASQLVYSQNRSYNVYLDLDNDATTGCTVSQPDFSTQFQGIDGYISVTTSDSPVSILSSLYYACNNSSFGSGNSVVDSALGLNTSPSGYDVFEMQLPFSELGINSSTLIKLYYTAGSNQSSDILRLYNGGDIVIGIEIPHNIPMFSMTSLIILLVLFLFIAKKAHNKRLTIMALVLTYSGIVWAMVFIIDGEISDWSGANAIVDPIGDNSSPGNYSDIAQAYVHLDDQYFTTRMDIVDVENEIPTANATNANVLEEGSVLITLTGNDIDGDNLTFAIANTTTNGQLSVITQIDSTSASLIYTPNPDFFGNDSFTYVSNDGQINSSEAIVTIVVDPVNDQPTFDASASINIIKDSGLYSAPWATNINTGAANESTQLLSFGVISNDNPVLIPVNPVISPTGVISFTPSVGGNGTANLTIQLQDDGGTTNGGIDTSNIFNLAIIVEGVNDAPSFIAGGDQTVNEDVGLQTVVGWATALSAGPPDESGQILTFNITNNSNPSLFSSGPSVDGVSGDLTYTTTADANGMATITLNVQDNGGTANGGVDTSATQTFTINVTPVNDVPTYTNVGNVSVLKDAGPYSSLWASALSAGPSDESGQILNFNITGITNPGLFSSPPDVDSSGNLTFDVTPDTSGTSTVSINLMDDGGTANGGVDTTASLDFDIVVGGVNDAPSFIAGADVSVFEDAGLQTVAAWATALSPGPADESGQTLTFNITNNTNPGLFSVAPSVDGVTGDLTYTSAANINGMATITLNVMDNGGTGNGGVDTSATQSFVITVDAVNDVPSFTPGPNVTVLEESGAYSLAWTNTFSEGPSDESGQSLSFNITNNSNAGLFSVAPAVSTTGILSFTPAVDASGTATISINIMDDGGTANGGVDTSADIMFDIIITDINDEPSFTAGGNESVLEDAGAQSVIGWATAISAGPPSESSQTLSFNLMNDNNALFSVQPSVSPNGTLTYTTANNANGTATVTLNIMDDGGTTNGGDDTSPDQMFVITVTSVNDEPGYTSGGNIAVFEDSVAYNMPWASALTAGPADESGQTLSFNVTGNSAPTLFLAGPSISNTGQLTFTPAADAVGTATITANIMDNGGTANGGVDTSVGQMFTITLNQVNDEPSFTVGVDQSSNQNAGLQTVNSWIVASSAGPANESGQTLSYNLSNDNNALFSSQPSVNSAGDLSYTSAMNMNGSAVVTINVMDNGGIANGGDDTSPNQTFNITILDPPPAKADPSFSVTTNIQVNTPAGTGLLSGATGSGPLVVGNAMNPAPTVTTGGGNLSIVTATGAFTYNPPAGLDTGTDTFVYKICNPSQCSADITATLNLSGNTTWFIVNSGTPGDGRLTTPFNSMAAFMAQQNGGTQADPDVSDCIFIDSGNHIGPFTLLNNQKVIGKGSTTTVATECVLAPAVNSAPLPTTNGARPVITSAGNGINVASGNTLRGIDIGNASNKLVGAVFGTLTINDMLLIGTGKAIDLTNGTAAIILDSLNSSNSFDQGIDMDNVAGSFTITGPAIISGSLSQGISIINSSANVNVNTGSISTANNNSFRVSGNTGTVTYGGTINHNIPVAAVSIVGNTAGVTTLSGVITANTSISTAIDMDNHGTVNLSGGMALTTTSGSAFTSVNAGTINVTGTNTISSTTGTAVVISGVNIGASNVNFQSVSTDGSDTGMSLTSLTGVGSISVTGIGSINGSGGTIQNNNTNGIFIQNTNNVFLNNMNFTNATDESVGCNAGVAGVTGNCNAAIEINNVSNINLINITIDGNGDASDELGIFGQNVTNFDMNGVTVQNVSDAINEHGIYIVNLLGSAASSSHWQNLTVNNTIGDTAILIAQTSGMGELLVDGTSTVSNALEGGFEARTNGPVAGLIITIDDTTIENTNTGASFFAIDGSIDASVTNSTISAGTGIASISRMGSGTNGVMFVGIAGQSTNIPSSINLSVDNNMITQEDGGAGGTGRSVSALSGSSNVNGTITSNVIASDDDFVDGLFTNFTGTGNVADNVINVNNNTMNMSGTGLTIAGVEINASDSNGGLAAIAQGNTITYGGTNTFSAGIVMVAGDGSGPDDANTLCSHVINNDINNLFLGSFAHYGFVNQTSATTTKNIQGLPPGVVTDAQVDAYIIANDVDIGDITTASDVNANFGTINGTVNCL